MIPWKEPEYKLVTTKEQLLELSKLAQYNITNDIPIGIDCETTGPHPQAGLDCHHGWLLGFSICFNKNTGYYIPLSHIDQDNKLLPNQVKLDEVVSILNPVLSSGGLYIGHNIKFDYKFLWQSGIELFPRFWDTCIAIQLINGVDWGKRALKKIIKDWVDIPLNIIRTFEDVSEGDAAKTDPTNMLTYAVNDSLFVYHLYEAFKPLIDSDYKKIFYRAEMPLIPVLAHIELRGIILDASYFLKQKTPLIKHRDNIAEKVKKEYNINIGSPAQILELFTTTFDGEEFPFIGKGQKLTTDEAFLKKILEIQKKNKDGSFYKLVKDVLEYRAANKVLNTYLIKFIDVSRKMYEDGKIVGHVLHTNFDQMKNSGRMSSSPNIQNIPRFREADDIIPIPVDVRRGFIARPGYKIIDADWSSAELRLVAIASNEPLMRSEYIKNPRSADLHTLTTQGIFNKEEVTKEERHIGKTLNFSVLYGATEYAVSNLLECTKDEAKNHINNFFNFYTGIKEWKAKVENQILNNRYTKTFYGRKRYLQPGYSPQMQDYWKYNGAVRELTNHIIQGSCADMLKFALVDLTRKFINEDLDAHIIATTHDSITVEAREDLVALVQEYMKEVMEITINDILLPIDLSVQNSFSKEY